MVRLQPEEIRPAELIDAVGGPAAGAISLFLGTVREQNRHRRVVALEYHVYTEMARRELQAIESETLQRFEILRLTIAHRTGRLAVGDSSVGVAVAAAHREAAFEACRFVIDALKRRAPIWKKEIYDDDEAWLEGS